MDQSLNRSIFMSDEPEETAHRVRVQENVETTSPFDTGTDTHAMLKNELGDPELQPTTVALCEEQADKTSDRCANC